MSEELDEFLQECGLCRDLFDIQQVSIQISGQILCAKCAKESEPE